MACFDQGRAIDTTGASAAGATKDVPYVHWSDLRPPATLDVFGKSVEIHDADPFTKRFFALQTGQPVDYQVGLPSDCVYSPLYMYLL